MKPFSSKKVVRMKTKSIPAGRHTSGKVVAFHFLKVKNKNAGPQKHEVNGLKDHRQEKWKPGEKTVRRNQKLLRMQKLIIGNVFWKMS